MHSLKISGLVSVFILVAACVTVTAHDGQVASVSRANSQTAAQPARIPQYERYKTVISTPLRGLEVNADFSLIDNWSSFMRYHDNHVKGSPSVRWT